MPSFTFFATPWWVNAAIVVPFAAWRIWRKKKLALTRSQLALASLFGVAFGFVEAAVVIYLRFALGTFTTAAPLQSNVVPAGAATLLTVETAREIATIVMLATVALLASKGARERWAIFLWAFAVWDASYYLFLSLIIHWPPSPMTTDLLFLIPAPWHAAVWFPLLIDALVFVAVLVSIQS